MTEPLVDRLSAILSNRTISIKSEWEAREAAVLLPLFRANGQWHLVFTRRTDVVEQHRGQVSFPGGLIEAQDPSPQDTALREAEEEIGIKRESVQVLGPLDALMTVTQFLIYPFVGLIPWPAIFSPNAAEVARVFHVPLTWLSDPNNLEVHERQPLAQGPQVPVYYFKEFDGETIWGATARITLNFLGLLTTSDGD